MPRPAMLGGTPAFTQPLPFNQPTLPPWEVFGDRARRILDSGMVTKGPVLVEYERAAAEHLGVAEVVAVASCTTGLILTLQALGLAGEVIVPSFSFPATFHALAWNRLTPVFAECDPATFCLDPVDAAARITKNTVAIVGVFIFGNPAGLPQLEAAAARIGVPLVMDAAHGLGAAWQGGPVGGQGAAQVFSTSPTKLLATGEGGLIATNDSALAERVRVAREYGNPGDYNCVVSGLNGRLPELSALLGLLGLPHLEDWSRARNRLAAALREALDGVPGLTFQTVPAPGRSSYKDIAFRIAPREFGMSRDDLARALAAEGVPTRTYFNPPGHLQTASQGHPQARVGALPATEALSREVLCVPVNSHMEVSVMRTLGERIRLIRDHAASLAQK